MKFNCLLPCVLLLGSLMKLALSSKAKQQKNSKQEYKKEPPVPNFFVGSQAISSPTWNSYRVAPYEGHTYDEPGFDMLTEFREGLSLAGSNQFKFKLSTDTCESYKLSCDSSSLASLLELSQEPEVAATFDDPAFHWYHIWTYSFNLPKFAVDFTEALMDAEYQEMYDWAMYVLETYQDTGKVFFVGNWEGDLELMWSGGCKTNGKYDFKCVPTEQSIDNYIWWARTRQGAIDDAKNDAKVSGVDMFYYLEFNLERENYRSNPMLPSESRPTILNSVVPEVNPDYLSYSSYKSTNKYINHQGRWFNQNAVDNNFWRILDYAESKLQSKNGTDFSVIGDTTKRVFIGEFGPNKNNEPNLFAPTAAHVFRAALEWGCPFVLQWGTYDNPSKNTASLVPRSSLNLSQMGPLRRLFKDWTDTAQEYLITNASSQDELRQFGVQWFSNWSPSPTEVPSASLSSSKPSPEPTSKPSSRPSSRPSSGPSSTPSSGPSSGPSTGPSQSPTPGPSAAPSAGPSTRPSVQPSASPSSRPSSQPSSGPTSVLHARSNSFNGNFFVGSQAIYSSKWNSYRIAPFAGHGYDEPGYDMLTELRESIAVIGSNLFKFSLSNRACVSYKLGCEGLVSSLTQLAQVPEIANTFADPAFQWYHIWTYSYNLPKKNVPFTQALLDAEYQETFDWAMYMLETYQNTGKVFFVGNWEGDWELMWGSGCRSDGKFDFTCAPSQEFLDKYIWYSQTRQKAIDDAKKASNVEGVDMFFYIEFNLEQENYEPNPELPSMIRPTILNSIIPAVNPDYLSYSSYKSTNKYNDHEGRWFDQGVVDEKFWEILDYAEEKLQPKGDLDISVMGGNPKRVFIGEFGPNRNQDARLHAPTAAHVFRAALEWGCPFILQWETYDNDSDVQPLVPRDASSLYILSPLQQLFKDWTDDAKQLALESNPSSEELRLWAVEWFKGALVA